MNFLLASVILQVLLLMPTIRCDITPALCGGPFLNRCLCGDMDNFGFLVNCTNTGFTNASALAHLPSQSESLIFNGNNISVLPSNVFGEEDKLQNLKYVDMSNNAIKEIRGKAFHHVASVRTLLLDHNELSLSAVKFGVEDHDHRHPRMFSNFVNLQSLHLTNAFRDNSPSNLANDLHDIFINSNLSALIKLHLEQNELTGFADPMVFCDLPSLMDLHLGDNFLRGLHFNITCLHNLRFLDLRRNRITRLSKSDLAMLDSFPARGQNLTIALEGNPFCDCEDLLEWLKTTKVVVRNKASLLCKPSYEVSGNSKEDAMHHVSCPTLHKLNSIHTSSIALEKVSYGLGRGATLSLTLISITAVGLALGFLYAKRVHFKPQCSSLLDTVSRKVHYTSIGHHEEEVDV